MMFWSDTYSCKEITIYSKEQTVERALVLEATLKEYQQQ